MTLPGWPVPILGGKLPAGYEIREDTDLVYLCFGSDEVVAVFDARVATVRLVDRVLNNDIAKRARKAVVLSRKVAT